MKAKRFWLKVILWVLATAILLWIITTAESFQQCVRAQPNTSSEQSSEEGSTDFVSMFGRCTGSFIEANDAAMLAIFTFVLAVSTSFLWLETRNTARAALEQGEIIKSQQRAFVYGGGPTELPDAGGTYRGEVCMTIENRGQTPGYLHKVEWGLCDEAIFPADRTVTDIIERNLLPPGVVKLVDRQNVISPRRPTSRFIHARFNWSENMGKIYFGRFTYSDVFGNRHQSTFKLKLATGRVKPSSDPMPGFFDDWT